MFINGVLFGKQFFLCLALITLVTCKVKDDKSNKQNENSAENMLSYGGEYFPDKYLEEDVAPTVKDMNSYIEGLSKVVNYFANLNLNKTQDASKALAMFFVRGTLKRTILDYWEALNTQQYEAILDILNKTAIILSHYAAGFNHDFSNKEYRVILALSEPMTFAYSLDDFKSNSMKKWIRRKSSINKYLEVMDKKLLSRREYQRLVFTFVKYHIAPRNSDFCLQKIIFNPDPLNMSKMMPCKPDPLCYKELLISSPSIAYTLSHRIANLILYRLARRCYFESIDKDEEHIESLCAQMYRESVYIARSGFFARDMFMEHVGLCATMGYKEFYRRNWFNKMNSWIDQKGCMEEDMNYAINRTVLLKNILAKDNINADDKLKAVYLRKCQDHVMAVYLFAMVNAVRYAAHHVAATSTAPRLERGPHWVPPPAKIKHI